MYENEKNQADFAALTAHELKTPLQAIGIYCRVLREELFGSLSSDAQEALDGIEYFSRCGAELIDGIISYSQVISSPFLSERTDLGKLAESCVEVLKKEHPYQRIHAQIAPLPVIYGDSFLLRRAFLNILENSVKFSEGRLSVEISISCKEKEGRQYISFTDNGVGFSHTDADPFELYSRIHSGQEYSGAGIGLAAVKSIMERHGGSAEIRSEPDCGCTVTLMFPGG